MFCKAYQCKIILLEYLDIKTWLILNVFVLLILILKFTTQRQCCQHLLTRNPKIYEENPGKSIDFRRIDS